LDETGGTQEKNGGEQREPHVPRITMKPDNLNERNTEFAQAPLPVPVFLNSVPKCGTHLIRNVMRMFVPVPQQYHATFVQLPILRQHMSAFDPANPKLSWGHMLFSDHSSAALVGVRHVLMVRDPYDWVLARARFFLSENFQADLEHLKGGRTPVGDLLSMMIFGIHQKAPSLGDFFVNNAVAWLGTAAYLVRYEDMIANLKRLDTLDAQAYFFNLFAHCGIDPPDDWRERVRIGSDRKQSSTARENLVGANMDIPDELPVLQKRMVDVHVPGLRALLGYA
jgi:hypothetical protein